MAVTIDKKVDPESEFYSDKTVLVAKTGYGKSYTARVLIEEGVAKGHTFIIIDPQDAYRNLPDFEYIEAQNVKSVKGLAILLSQTNRNVVISPKKLTLQDQNKFIAVFLRNFKQHIRRGIQTLVIDEIHKYAPEGQKTEAKGDVIGLFQESRSDGLGIIAVTQRPQRLDKTCLAQAENFACGRVTAFRDKDSIKNYMDTPDDVEKLSKLEKGEFMFFGFGHEEPIIGKVRKASSEHSGNTPKNLLNEDKALFNRHASRYVKKSSKMDAVDKGKELVKDVIPSKDGFMSLAVMGMKASLGTAVGGVVGTLVGSRVKSPIPVVSSRTLGSLGSTIVLYAGYKMVPMESVSSVLKYAAAGSAAFTVGSFVYDLVSVANVQLPSVASFALTTATGAQPLSNSSQTNVDTNTAMA
ncbi:MAG: DUF87 domain-containing protein [Nanoarchaeota archaeon]|nr:DUF87 domain-containing protein [Nanoarchaeota archaeon]